MVFLAGSWVSGLMSSPPAPVCAAGCLASCGTCQLQSTRGHRSPSSQPGCNGHAAGDCRCRHCSPRSPTCVLRSGVPGSPKSCWSRFGRCTSCAPTRSAPTPPCGANVAYPTDLGLLARAVDKLAATAKRVQAAGGATRSRVRDRRRAARRRAHEVARAMRPRTEQPSRSCSRSPGRSLAWPRRSSPTPAGS
jgi:hypothetical protein